MKLRSSAGSVCINDSNVKNSVDQNMVERDLADVLVVEYESNGDRRLVAYLLNLDLDYCCRILPTMFDPPDRQPPRGGGTDELELPESIVGKKVSAIRKFIRDLVGTLLEQGEVEIPLSRIKRALYEKYCVSFSEYQWVIERVASEEISEWEDRYWKRTGQAETTGKDEEDGKQESSKDRDLEEDGERKKATQTGSEETQEKEEVVEIHSSPPMIPYIEITPISPEAILIQDMETKARRMIKKTLEKEPDASDATIMSVLFQDRVIEKTVSKQKSYSFAPLIRRCRMERSEFTQGRTAEENKAINIMMTLLRGQKRANNFELGTEVIRNLGPEAYNRIRNRFPDLCTEARRKLKILKSVKKDIRIPPIQPESVKPYFTQPKASSQGKRAQVKPPARAAPQPRITSQRPQTQVSGIPQRGAQAHRTATVVPGGAQIQSRSRILTTIPLARIVDIMDGILVKQPDITVDRLRQETFQQIVSTRLRSFKATQVDYQDALDSLTEMCRRIVRLQKEMTIKDFMERIRRQRDLIFDQRRKQSKRFPPGEKIHLPAVLNIRSPTAAVIPQPEERTDSKKEAEEDDDDIETLVVIKGGVKIEVRDPKLGEDDDIQEVLVEEKDPDIEEIPLVQVKQEVTERDEDDPISDKRKDKRKQSKQDEPPEETKPEKRSPKKKSRLFVEPEKKKINWPCSEEQIRALIKTEMKREDYHEITIDDLLKVLYQKTGWSFKQLRSEVAGLANEAREKRIADDMRAATLDRENLRKEREEEERQEEERKRITKEVADAEEREYMADEEIRIKKGKKKVQRTNSREDMLATLKVIVYSTEQIHVESLKNEGWRRLLRRAGQEYKRISKNEKNGLLEMIRNKIIRFVQDKEEKDDKKLPEGIEMDTVRATAEKVARQGNFPTMSFAKWYYTLQRELGADLINFITIIKELFLEYREKPKKTTLQTTQVRSQKRQVKSGEGSLPLEEPVVKNRMKAILNLAGNFQNMSLDRMIDSLTAYFGKRFTNCAKKVEGLMKELREEELEKTKEPEPNQGEDPDEDQRPVDNDDDDDEDPQDPQNGASRVVKARKPRTKEDKLRNWHAQAYRVNIAEHGNLRKNPSKHDYYVRPPKKQGEKKWPPGKRALLEVRHYQRRTNLLINPTAFLWYIRETLHKIWKRDFVANNRMLEGIRMETLAVKTLQEAVEAYIVEMFTYTQLAALHRRPRKAKKEKKENVTVAEEDLELIRMITGKFEHGELEESEKFGGESGITEEEPAVKYGKPDPPPPNDEDNNGNGEPTPKRRRKSTPKKK